MRSVIIATLAAPAQTTEASLAETLAWMDGTDNNGGHGYVILDRDRPR
jgi:hypothetical protein